MNPIGLENNSNKEAKNVDSPNEETTFNSGSIGIFMIVGIIIILLILVIAGLLYYKRR